tara:strand:- start:20191 stop:20691 length:501 start_codon:yes stop_codon:yes gene_type:complete
MKKNYRTLAYIGLGSNLQDPSSQIAIALRELALLPESDLEEHSGLYLSRPMGPPDQPVYVNAVASIKTNLEPEELLNQLQSIENQHGRERLGEHWGPRTLDLDILSYGNKKINSARLTIPHPGVRLREFVLYPLQEIDKNLIIAGVGRVDRLSQKCYANGLVLLED